MRFAARTRFVLRARWRSARALTIALGALGCGILHGLEAPSDHAAPAPDSFVIRLRFCQADSALLCREVPVERTPGFTREPAYSRPVRGLLRLGTDTNQFVGYAWDQPGRRAYLDLNRNGDLTDDPRDASLSTAQNVDLMAGVPFGFSNDQGDWRVFADLQFVSSRVYLNVRSMWEGSFELGGMRWYLAVIDNGDGRIAPVTSLEEIGDRMILRRWEERNDPWFWWHATLSKVRTLDHLRLVTTPYRRAGNAEVFDGFNLPSQLFVRQSAFRMEYRFDRGAPSADLLVTCIRTDTPLGTLHLSGEHVRRVVLDSATMPGGFTVVLDRPGAEVEVPQGAYPRQLVLLQREGFTNVAVGVGTNALVVSQANTTEWWAGGPLKNTATVVGGSSYDRVVHILYGLTNECGTTFQLVYQNTNAPARVEIRHQGEMTMSGDFRYG